MLNGLILKKVNKGIFTYPKIIFKDYTLYYINLNFIVGVLICQKIMIDIQ